MDDILDENFYKKEPVEKIEIPTNDEEDPFIPRIRVESRDLEVVTNMLEQHEIPYEVQQGNNFDETGIVPLTASQLDSVVMTVFIPKSTIPTADEIMASYKAAKEAQLAKQAAEDTADFMKMLVIAIGCILFLFYLYFSNL